MGKRYLDTSELEQARKQNVVDNDFVSSHDRPKEVFAHMRQRFHFLSSPHYHEGAGLFTLRHKGRIMIMMRHPVIITESMYLTRPNTERGDMVGLLNYVSSPDYYDNWMTRMLANVPKDVVVTEEHFKQARMILENKFLIGMTNHIGETVEKRIKLYFGWDELPSSAGTTSCELDLIKKGTMGLDPCSVEEGGYHWRAIQKINLFDMKLYARAMSVYGLQKMRLPVHPVVAQKDREVVSEAFGNLRNVDEAMESTDVPFFW